MVQHSFQTPMLISYSPTFYKKIHPAPNAHIDLITTLYKSVWINKSKNVWTILVPKCLYKGSSVASLGHPWLVGKDPMWKYHHQILKHITPLQIMVVHVSPLLNNERATFWQHFEIILEKAESYTGNSISAAVNIHVYIHNCGYRTYKQPALGNNFWILTSTHSKQIRGWNDLTFHK